MEERENIKPDYDFLTKIHSDVNFYDIVRELQDTGREEIYDSDILYCMVKASKAYHQSQLQALKEEGVQLINQVIEGLLHKDDEYQIDFTAQITELREVLTLITNLEDNG